MKRNLQRYLFVAVIAIAAVGVAGTALAQGAPMTPITTPSASPSSVSTPSASPSSVNTYTAVASGTAAVSGTEPTPNAPVTGSGGATSRSEDALFFAGAIAAMFAVALAGGWIALNGVSRRRR